MSARLVVLASGTGTTLQAVLDAVARGELAAEVVAVGSDRPGCRALARAEAAGVPTFALPVSDFADRAEWNRAFAGAIDRWRPDLVVCAGFMRVLGPSVVHRFRIVNTHPSLLPDFPGAHAIRDVLTAAVPTTGVTVHWVDDGVDTGPVLAQQPVAVLPGDDEDSLRERIQAVEKPLYVATIRRLLKELPEMSRIPVHRALVSVSDKTGVAELAAGLHAAGVELVSTGSTAVRIAEAGVPVTAVEDVTGFPEILDGRVKSLHPKIHGGLLARRDDPAHPRAEDGLDAGRLLPPVGTGLQRHHQRGAARA